MADVTNKSGRVEGRGGGLVLQVEPRVCLHDVSTIIRVTGVDPHSPITLRADTYTDGGDKFSSHAHYISDEKGTVDVRNSESVGGSYKGVFPAGLLSTLKGVTNARVRLYKEDPTTPWKVKVTACEGHVTQQEEQKVNVVSTMMERHLMGPGVTRVRVHHGKVRGGFASLALPFFSYEDLPKKHDIYELDYFEEAVEFLLSQPRIIPDRCALFCSSKAAEISLTMAIHLEKVKAVFSVCGSVAPMLTTMTYRGKELWKGLHNGLEKFVTYDSKNQGIIFVDKVMQDFFRDGNSFILPCETAPDDTYFLFVAGDEDTTRTEYSVQAMAHRMKLHGRENQCRTIVYPGVGHIIEMPYNTFPEHSYNNVKLPGSTKEEMVASYWAGNAVGFCKAQEDLWQQARSFFELHVRDQSHWYQNFLEESCRKENET
ncbi:Acyl-coenzyme A thioesterase 1-like [Homarus americanus]|uniref:Acyl-coenzyme A thioesterase 1-like n=1 Tax=Homarus americanus TaxID=6706 RepID=A0A8J5JUN3_HOMAM|nr:Acyl-coenzyme A thioesterase 1-like [Homarus americanus]